MAQRSQSSETLDHWRRWLDRCWNDECDIDPLILRTRLLSRWGRWRQARCVEQELLPIL